MASEVNIVINAKDNASGVLKGVSHTMGNVAKVAATIGVAAVGAFVALGKSALDATAEWERMEMTMQSLVARELKASDTTLTMADALDKASGRSEELLGWIQKLAIQSPFDLEGVATAFRTALAYGFVSEEAQRLTQNMIDFAAGTGQSTAVMNQIALALGQVRAKGKLAGQEILQLVNAGVPVNDILKDMGFTLDDVSKGLVKADDFLEAFSTTMEEDFGGAAARQTNTWAGLLNSLDDIEKIGLRELFAGIFDELQPMVAGFADWLQGDGLKQLQAWGKQLGGIAKAVIGVFQSLKSTDIADALTVKLSEGWVLATGRFQQIAESVDWGGLSTVIAEKIKSIDWATVGNNLILGVQNLILGLWAFLSGVNWAALFDSITLAVADFIAGMFGSTFEQTRAAADQFWAELFAKFEGMKAIVVGKLSETAGAIQAIVGGAWVSNFVTALNSLIPFSGTFMATLEGIFRTKLGAISKLFFERGSRIVTQFLNAFNNAAPKILSAVGALVDAINAILKKIKIPTINIPVITSTGGNKGGGGTCFIGGTPVLTPAGLKPIEQMQVGDTVLSYTGNELELAQVVETFAHPAGTSFGYYLFNDTIGVTGEHLLYVDGAWKQAEDVEIGDNLLGEDLQPVAVESIRYIGEQVRTYNLHTDKESHNYFASGILAHNAKGGGTADGGVWSGPSSGYFALLHGTEAVFTPGQLDMLAKAGFGRSGGVVVNLTYAPAVSLASEAELERHLLPVIQRGVREARRN